MVKPVTAGRMGNFLFQAATAIAYALRHRLPYTLPNTTKNANHNPIYLQHLVHPGWEPNRRTVELKEASHAYAPLECRSEWRDSNILIHGWRQSEKYFLDQRDEIIRLFNYPWLLREGFVSVHVRRGDYLKLRHKHPPVLPSWYIQQMDKFPGCRFVFYSDDLPWCKATFGNRSDVQFSTGANEVEDLVSMASCEHHICSASTFSWWGAWLNQNPVKRIIIPRQWFMPGHGGLDASDIVPESWEKH